MTDNAILDDLDQYREAVIQQHLDQPRRSCLGAACCQMCGRPRQDCTCGGWGETYTDEDWAELVGIEHDTKGRL